MSMSRPFNKNTFFGSTFVRFSFCIRKKMFKGCSSGFKVNEMTVRAKTFLYGLNHKPKLASLLVGIKQNTGKDVVSVIF